MEDVASQYESHKILQNFDLETRARIIREVERRVEEALFEERKAIDLRREKLREMYNAEAQKITDSASSYDLKTEEEKYEEMKKKIMEIESRRERERLELVKKKKAQQKFLNCEEIRSVLSKQRDEAIKRDQWWQINEKLAISSTKAKEDEYYHDLILQNVKDAMKLDEETSKMKWQKEVEIKQGYLQQVEYKNKAKEEEFRRKEKEKLEIQLLIQKAKECEQQELREKQKRREELATEMKRLVQREKEVRRQRRIEEKVMGEEIELIGSGNKGIDKLTFKREMDAYRTFLAELTTKRKAEEKRFDEKLEEVTNEREKRRSIERRKLELAREELRRSVFHGREEQLKQKTEFEKIEKERNVMEKYHVLKEIGDYQCELENSRMAEIERKRRYAEELKQQMKQRDQIKIHQKEEKAREREAALAEEARIRRELEDLMVNPPGWDKHPLQGVKVATFFIPQK